MFWSDPAAVALLGFAVAAGLEVARGLAAGLPAPAVAPVLTGFGAAGFATVFAAAFATGLAATVAPAGLTAGAAGRDPDGRAGAPPGRRASRRTGPPPWALCLHRVPWWWRASCLIRYGQACSRRAGDFRVRRPRV